ncbi:MAG TPA: FxsA family protein [Actinomycetes bacterium]|nr:FxsA family protein [Actinomycetes bacterium]
MGLVLVVLFLVVPIVEIAVIVQVGQVIGPWPTVLLLLLESALGAWLVRREGRRAWDTLRTAGATGRLPSRELADAGLVLVGGTLLLTPGFVTDVVGFFLILPVTRPLARRMLAWFVARRATAAIGRRTGIPPSAWRSTSSGGTGPVVPGEVVRDVPPEGPERGPDSGSPGRATGG